MRERKKDGQIWEDRVRKEREGGKRKEKGIWGRTKGEERKMKQKEQKDTAIEREKEDMGERRQVGERRKE